jgi:hypothetical protein
MTTSRFTRGPLTSLAQALVIGFIVASVGACTSQAPAPAAEQAPPADPMSDGAENVRLVGYNDLQGRQSLQLTTRSDAANGNWVYVGHQPNARPTYDQSEEPQMNPVTGQAEINGTSLIDITDPAKPTTKWHIPGISGANHRSVSVVYDYTHDKSGRDYLIRSSDTGEDFRFQIFDITDRATNPQAIKLVSEIRGTPPNSCGRGCGGPFIRRAHKGYWSEESGRYYSSSGEPGFRGLTILHIWDLTDPTNPRFISRGWYPGQKETEPQSQFEGQYVHHPIVDEANNRVYAGGRTTSGQMGAWDISDVRNPRLAWVVDTSPPNRGPHTVTPIVYNQVPNIKPHEPGVEEDSWYRGPALPRLMVLASDEASGGPDMKPCQSGIRARVYMFDVTDETHPTQVSQFEVPVGSFCDKGGRFGPHQHAEAVNGRLNRHEDRIAWVAYFNAGVRVLDLSNPYQMRELGYYVPMTNANSHPMEDGQPTAIQINDVTVDHRGLAYATDRVGTGMFVFEYTGPKPGAAAAQPTN